MKTIFLDTETTGLNQYLDEVLEISIIDDAGAILLDTLVQPINKTKWPDAQRIHGISPEMIQKANAPTLVSLAGQILEIFNDADILVVYNLNYDKPFVWKALREAQVLHGLKEDLMLQCAMVAFAEKNGEWDHFHGQYKWKNLKFASQCAGHVWEGKAHRALADCQATRSVWEWLNK